VFVATDPKFDVKALADALLSKELECKMVVCQDLGYEEERFIHGTSRSPPEPTSDLFAVMLGHW